jgi:DNA-binding transcriptional MerR regulator
MRIGELAQWIGVSTDSVRFYERSGLLPRPARQDNTYRRYTEADAEHLRLLIDLRRLDLPLDDAARIAGWCHSGHCADTTTELPPLIEARREEIAARGESFEVVLAPEPPLDPAGAPGETREIVAAYAAAGATALNLRFRQDSLGHYLEQLEAMAELGTQA